MYTFANFCNNVSNQNNINEITDIEIKNVEKFADKLFAKLNIDIVFTKHFKERMNDKRNKKDISAAELIRMFRELMKQHKEEILDLKPGDEKVLNDLLTDLNMPFVLKYDNKNKEIDFISKTIMRKKNFKTPDQKIYLK